MKKILYWALSVAVFLASCSETLSDRKVLTVRSVDVSDFVVYAGSPSGGIEVEYNNLKKAELLNYFFKGKYNPKLYDTFAVEFNQSKLTYTYPEAIGSVRKIVSGYIYDRDSLFIFKNDGSRRFVALGTSDNLYRQKSLARFKNKALRDTVLTFDETLSLDPVLKLRGISSIKELRDVKDTIAWCNVVYLFE